MLVNAGADVNCIEKKDGCETPLLTSAIYKGNVEMVDFLLSKGANPCCETVFNDGSRSSALKDSIVECSNAKKPPFKSVALRRGVFVVKESRRSFSPTASVSPERAFPCFPWFFRWQRGTRPLHPPFADARSRHRHLLELILRTPSTPAKRDTPPRNPPRRQRIPNPLHVTASHKTTFNPSSFSNSV